jgi:sulfur carrier protein ThiS adenylyltransferase
MQQGGHVEATPYLISFTIGDHRLVIFQDGRVLIHGTKDIAEARSLYTRYCDKGVIEHDCKSK